MSGPVTGRPSNSLWNKKGIQERGEAVEEALLGRQRDLPWNYQTIDDFSGNIATSIKSMDLLSPSAQNVSYLRKQISEAAKKLDNFVPTNYGSAQLRGEVVNDRILRFAFERGSATREQSRALVDIASDIRTQFPNVNLKYEWIP